MPLVGLSGLEPPTSRLSGARSNLLSYKPIWRFFVYLFPLFCPLFSSHLAFSVKSEEWRVNRWVSFGNSGGDDGIRTHDPLLAGQVLSQLSYTPIEMNPQNHSPGLMILQNRTTIRLNAGISSSLVKNSMRYPTWYQMWRIQRIPLRPSTSCLVGSP